MCVSGWGEEDGVHVVCASVRLSSCCGVGCSFTVEEVFNFRPPGGCRELRGDDRDTAGRGGG